VGKSRLAIEIASATTAGFPDGAAFIALENVTEPALLIPSIAYGSASATRASSRSRSAWRWLWTGGGC
jgi:predicted ATPase